VLGQLSVLLLVDRINFLEILLILVLYLGVGVAHLANAGVRPHDLFNVRVLATRIKAYLLVNHGRPVVMRRHLVGK
jgi:hypothetical protein